MTYAYNNDGRLATTTAGTSLVGTYTYDGLERLSIRVVTNTTPSGTIHVIYDTAGHVLAEANGLSGVTTREYVWLPNEQAADPGPMSAPMQAGLATGKLGAAEDQSDPTSAAQLISLNGIKPDFPVSVMPLAVFSGVDSGAPVTYYVHADHLDRPIMMTDASQNPVWSAIYKPFGEVYSITGSASLDARFPGQWFELETGLAYNWHRHYDATTGRYTTPDPLGFVDGPSLYAYVEGQPTQVLDPNGLKSGSGPYTPSPGGANLCLLEESCVDHYVKCVDSMGNGRFPSMYSCGSCLRYCTGANGPQWPFHLCPY